MAEAQNVEEINNYISQLAIEKKKLQKEVEIMQYQKDEYYKNKEFYDKLILFHQKIDQLKDARDQIQRKNAQLYEVNDMLKEKISFIYASAKDKNQQETKLKELLLEITAIKDKLEA